MHSLVHREWGSTGQSYPKEHGYTHTHTQAHIHTHTHNWLKKGSGHGQAHPDNPLTFHLSKLFKRINKGLDLTNLNTQAKLNCKYPMKYTAAKSILAINFSAVGGHIRYTAQVPSLTQGWVGGLGISNYLKEGVVGGSLSHTTKRTLGSPATLSSPSFLKEHSAR